MGEVVGGEDEGLGEAAVTLFVLECVLFNLFENLAVAVGRCDGALDLCAFELALVFEVVEADSRRVKRLSIQQRSIMQGDSPAETG